MNRPNAARSHGGKAPTAREPASATCPTCGSPITRARHDHILQIDEARRQQLADERVAIEREREDISEERAAIASAAASAERTRWEAQAVRAEREVERARKRAEQETERLARQHERALQIEVRKREASERQLARKLDAAQGQATAAAERRIRDAVRAAHEKRGRLIDDLRVQLRTVEQRRQRDEDALKKTIGQLRERAESRDRMHFGPEGEEALLAVLRQRFAGDRVEHCGKAGDVLHTVLDAGRVAGTIVYECKQTKRWQPSYLRQTTAAMQCHGTRYGVLVSHTMPPRRPGLCVLGGVIVTEPAIVAQVVAVLRDGIVTISRLRISEEGKAAKTTALFQYLSGDDFIIAIRRIQERVVQLRDTLARERSHHDGWWRTREEQYAAILREASGIDARVNDLLGGRGIAAPRATAHALIGTGSPSSVCGPRGSATVGVIAGSLPLRGSDRVPGEP